MAKLFEATIRGVKHTASTEQDQDGTQYVLVKAGTEEQRYSPNYSAEELKFVLNSDQDRRNPQQWEAKKAGSNG